ncbi:MULTISPECIES: HAD family hydrolase [Halorubrum]|uniref:Haloacid dehalogenase superfamily, subfamily IA, variant 1 with third motif having Dx(3-4)D or Dx(3-4)E n=1 Tax=Halorubrum sodomense TaxID=35743 RepID=A0A1I6HQJ2_HALSD|nr:MULTISPECIES: HAD family hydrolase [Halorubrum]TKX55586.1 HAD family hydrolase [Halorubrum sp. SP3]TKX55965.1 HAD family hydrolase [Halorubrum sp. SS7]SFR56723.1 haloacid dehalogenase superfamily, subfamily IA, variant 1 with third motif having Dx(3-4)D or Dx(3-4)E [Halorubrum sodomense]
MTEYDTVLFDSDGVLVEPPTYETKVEATRAAFTEVGVKRPKNHHIDEIVNGTTVERLHEICAAYELDVNTFWEARERLDEESQFKKFESDSRTRYDDVTAISDVSQTCGIVSNNHHSTIEFVMDFFDLQSTFDTYYGREKTVESLDYKKPNTHYLDLALSELGGESALYVGDSEHDVIAAHQAGMDSVFVRRPHCTDVTLSTTPTYEINNLHEIPEIVG